MVMDEKVQKYIEAVCREVRNRSVHQLIREDVLGHLEEAYQEEVDLGATHSKAVDLAIERTGDPVKLGQLFHKIHRPQVDWLAILGIVLVGAVGVIVTVGAVPSVSVATPEQDVLRTVIGLVLGMLVGAGLFFVHPGHLRRLGPYVLVGTLLLMLVTDLMGRPINGEKQLFGVHIFELCPYLLALGFADIFRRPRWLRDWRILLLAALIALADLMFVHGHSNSNLILANISIFTIALSSKLPRWKVSVGAGTFLAAMTAYVLRNRWLVERFTGAFHAQDHAYTSGFYNYQTQLFVNHAGWFGHGLGHGSFILSFEHSTLAFAQLINMFGWCGGLLFAAVVLCIFARLFHRSQRVQNEFAQTIAFALLTLLAFQFIYPFCMGLGTFPIIGLSTPLIGGGLWTSVVALGSFGMVLGVLKRPSLQA
ncbi:FtsW/RodA/SpoVE family cell cycle protein [Alicyclobacillus dauci]|uniref:FtsW/RodA/SpoVE family cell cycle protein n=1 Tax=Alicyclobacillus dauci TaxID=1475485 RepID=A0ABY6Z6T9_9BACL|nr:FtsW/RodA/SpoVE family cell cycle protein [Alicyclobacillus dauci]WAH37745.1 FtsW/RodA/SpoVE family cell cycle protein [Alicyclobacillus dauci]